MATQEKLKERMIIEQQYHEDYNERIEFENNRLDSVF